MRAAFSRVTWVAASAGLAVLLAVTLAATPAAANHGAGSDPSDLTVLGPGGTLEATSDVEPLPTAPVMASALPVETVRAEAPPAIGQPSQIEAPRDLGTIGGAMGSAARHALLILGVAVVVGVLAAVGRRG